MTSFWKRLILPTAFLLTICGLAIGNDYYTHGGFPATGSVASSSGMRAELDSITAGFDKMPTFAGNANKAVVINGGATGLTVTSGTLGLAGNLSTTGAFNTTLAQGATTTLTLPLVNGTLATLAGTETLTNKTITTPAISAPVLSGSATGTYTLAGTPTITAPAISNPTFSGGGIFGGTYTGTYTLQGTPTINSSTINSPAVFGTVTGAASYTSPTLTSAILSGTVTGTYTIGGTPTHPDNIFTVGGSGDATKKVAFEVDGLTTSTTRTVTVPDRSFTLGPTLATEQATTSGTAINFTGIPSGTRRVTIHFNGVGTNGSSHQLIQIGPSGGIENTGYVSSSSNLEGANAAGIRSTAGYIIYRGTSAAILYGSVTLSLENAAAFSWCESGVVNPSFGATGGNSTTGGCKSTAAEIDRVRITTVNGTDAFNAGVINISYE